MCLLLLRDQVDLRHLDALAVLAPQRREHGFHLAARRTGIGAELDHRGFVGGQRALHDVGKRCGWCRCLGRGLDEVHKRDTQAQRRRHCDEGAPGEGPASHGRHFAQQQLPRGGATTVSQAAVSVRAGAPQQDAGVITPCEMAPRIGKPLRAHFSRPPCMWATCVKP